MDNGHQVETRNTAHFRHDYGSDQSDLRRLYEQAKIDQWNAATDIDWTVPLEGDGGLISDDLVDIHGTRFWDGLSGSRPRRAQPPRHAAGGCPPWCRASMAPCCCAASSSRTCRARTPSCSRRPRWPTRRGTTRCCSAISSCGSTARSIRLGGNVKEIFDTLLGTSSWYLKTIGLQLVAETFAVSLFRMLAESSKDAVLRQVCRRILQDEARHMGFAMLSLPAIVGQATEAEHREMEDFAVWALSRTLGGIFPLGAYQEMGFGKAELDEIKQFRRERAAGGDETAFRKYFRRDLHDGLVRNLRKVGLLTERITPSLQSFGIKLAA